MHSNCADARLGQHLLSIESLQDTPIDFIPFAGGYNKPAIIQGNYMISNTDWAFHRTNYATRYSHLSARAYARMFKLNENTARVRLKGALIDPKNEPSPTKHSPYWAFHRANYAARFSFLSIKEYAWEVGLSSYNTARVRLSGALTDPANALINLDDYHPRTGERLLISKEHKPQKAK